MRRPWERCDLCTAFVYRGDIGECRRDSPGLPTPTYSGMWPQVAADDYCRDGFRCNPESLYAEIQRLGVRVAELERDAAGRQSAGGQTEPPAVQQQHGDSQ